MPKLTAPLESIEAHGSLRRQITFRRSPRGAMGTRMPRHPHAIPQTLAANAAAVRYAHVFSSLWGVDTLPGWPELAKQFRLPLRTTIIKSHLCRWQQQAGFLFSPLDDESYDIPDAPIIAVNIRPGSSTPIITDPTGGAYFYVSIHRSANADEPADRRNVIGFLDFYDGPSEHEDAYNLHGDLYYRAQAWYPNDRRHTPSAAAVHIFLP